MSPSIPKFLAIESDLDPISRRTALAVCCSGAVIVASGPTEAEKSPRAPPNPNPKNTTQCSFEYTTFHDPLNPYFVSCLYGLSSQRIWYDDCIPFNTFIWAKDRISQLTEGDQWNFH